ncbi:NUDIX hydrolase [Haloplasma contractile]|uniref:CTP pyrophosphohydrolase protein n=1 Tax=Haloplasma contractile SSD-17B TaxID=1033810 RepID=F7Q2K1_9MOLU|nr:NUDIX domain-containing protein [Haloplasma contractile]ERJ11955.1 CTP pyrophosphohydrolase protein [Haloplasma contractile SSD-17B]
MSDIWYMVNVEAAIYKADKWLIIQRGLNEDHAPGMLSLVGGKVENAGIDQNILEKTLVREVREEVLLEIQNLNYLESKSFKTDDGKLVVDIVLTCEHKSGTATPVSKNEVEAVVWMTADEIIACDQVPGYLKETIKRADKIRLSL